jgi:hypothetical protein
MDKQGFNFMSSVDRQQDLALRVAAENSFCTNWESVVPIKGV